MRAIWITAFASLAVCNASSSWAQYGLYGSPETLQLSQQQTTQAEATPANYPTTATPQPALAPPGSTVQPQYNYPAQPPASAGYQPYQPGAQYSYPTPNSYPTPYGYSTQNGYPNYGARPPVRTAAVDPSPAIQPIPTPPGVATGAAATPVPAPAAVPSMQNPNMMSQMLAEQGSGCEGGVYRGAVGRFEQAACGNNACAYTGEGCYCPWYASMSALVLGRSDGRRVWTSYDDSDETIQLANTQFSMDWKWGGEARIGRRFCCGCVPYALEGVYWTTESFSGLQVTTNPTPGGYVSTPLNLNSLTFNGVSAENWFFGALEQSVYRRDEFHNFEINLIREQLAWASESPWDIGWSVGVRYFRFEELLRFSSLAQDGVSEAYFSDDITNNLIGAQFGFDAAYNLFGGLRAFITPKVGIYDNYMQGNFQARATTGGNTYNGHGPYGDFPVSSNRNGIAFLTQIDVGADWQFMRNWSARVGYRVVAITGMALADDQFPQYMCDTPEIANIQHYSSLILHGAFLGVTYNF